MSKRKITDSNLYDLLGVSSAATDQEIKNAYRKKALKCHPDKNPDNPKAAEEFIELSEVLAILTDPKAREAYDRTLKAKQLAKERLHVLDSKRRKFKEDLDRREQEAKKSKSKDYSPGLSDDQRLQHEIERLKKEGSRILREEQEFIRTQLKTKTTFPAASTEPHQAKPSSINPPQATQSFEDFEAFEAKILKQLAAAAAEQKKKAKLDSSEAENT
jgi:DnaJ family protein C protein 17